MSQKFEQYLKAEVVKAIENHGPLAGSETIERQLAESDLPLDTKILKRSASLVRDYRLGSRINAVIRQSAWITGLIVALFFILGALASNQAFHQVYNGTVNFYWLIVVLLGFNFLALMLWVAAVFSSYRNKRALNGLGIWIQQWAGRQLSKRVLAALKQSELFQESDPKSHQKSDQKSDQTSNQETGLGVDSQAFAGCTGKTSEISSSTIILAVYQILWRGDKGRWSGSILSHSLWLGYLLGGFFMILLMLSTRQYDFVWETTLLSAPSFVTLTEVLGWLPAKAGFLVPDNSQIILSRHGIEGLNAADANLLRQAWAGLLIGCIILYGLVPRFVLLFFSHQLYRRACGRVKPDLTQPYYVGLRNKLMPATRQFGIVDPDLKGRSEKKPNASIHSDIQLPVDAIYVGIELNADQPWPPAGVVAQRDLGRVDDGAGQQRVLTEVRRLAPGATVVAVVPTRRSPDRGQARFLEKLKIACGDQFFLGLSEGSFKSHSQITRQSDWYQLAVGIGIPADHIVRLEYVAQVDSNGPAVGEGAGAGPYV